MEDMKTKLTEMHTRCPILAVGCCWLSVILQISKFEAIAILYLGHFFYTRCRKLENIHCTCDANEFEKYLYSFNPHESPEPHYIPSRILKTCARESAPSISVLFK